MLCRIVLGFMCLLVLDVGSASRLVLTPSAWKIAADGTPDFTMTCVCFGCDGAAGFSPKADPGGVKDIGKFRILKAEDEFLWKAVVEYDADSGVPRLSERLENSTRYRFVQGHLAALQVRWEVASTSTGGDYVCEVMADSVKGQGVYLRSPTVHIDVQMRLTTYDLFQRMEAWDKKVDTVLDHVRANEGTIQDILTWQAEFNETKVHRSYPGHES